MKKLLLSMISLSFLIGCSNNDDNDTGSNNKNVEIQLNGAVQSTSNTNARPINSNFSTDFSVGIYANNGAWLAGTNWINNDNAIVSGAGAHSVAFASGPYYYPSDGSVLNFYAYAPHGTESTAAGAGTSPVITQTITGQEDVMWASATGNKVGSAAAVNPVLNFQHKLTQLQFTFKSGTGYPVSGNKVVSLVVKAQPTTVAMTVATGVCVFSGSADMQALSANDQTNGLSITTAGTNANSPVMTNVGTTYTLDVVVKPATGSSNVTYTGIPVNLTTVVGSAHMITLTFSNTEITATATVADWVTGSGGNATAQ